MDPSAEATSDHLDAHALDLVQGPAGCWELVGKASWSYQFSRFGETRGDAVFAGRIVDGEWKSFSLHPLGEVRSRRKEGERFQYVAEDRFLPLVGRLGSERVAEGAVEQERDPINALDAVFAEITSDVWTSEAGVGPDGTPTVMRRVELQAGGDLILEATFDAPDGLPVETTMTIPKAFRPKETPPGTRVAPGAKVEVRGRRVGDTVLPTAERFAFRVSWMGLAFDGAQSIAYTAANRCAKR